MSAGAIDADADASLRAGTARTCEPLPVSGRALALSGLERASGVAVGPVGPFRVAAPPPSAGADPRAALEASLLAALRRAPCVVSFSGGRDSSAMLAVALALARREGLAEPIPATLRFPGVASTEECDWQELVIGELRVGGWQRVELGDELDLLGETACAALRAHGLLWPPNAYLHVPLLELARGGSLVTGADGDGLLGDWRWARAQAVLHGRVRPCLRDALRVALALMPPGARRARLEGQSPRGVSWLRPEAQRELARLLAAERASEPRPWDRRVGWYARRRCLRLTVHSLGLLAAARDVRVHHPLLDPCFLAALASRGGPVGFTDRTSAMRALFGDVLPAASIERRGKAEFGRAVWRADARAFAACWTGAGVNPAMVDAERLRAAWTLESPPLAAGTLLHAAWLASVG